jgi:hypothetical protein
MPTSPAPTDAVAMDHPLSIPLPTGPFTRPDAAQAKDPLLDAEGHVCAFFHTEDEEYRVLLPFIQDGFDHGERACHIVNAAQRDDHLRRLAEAGIDVVGAEATGQLIVLDWSQTYLEGGHFDQDRTMSQLASSRDEGHRLGYSRTRYVAHMEWALERENLFDVAVYEATSNLAPLKPNVAICVYQVPQWDGPLLVNALRTHPLVILGGLLHENPFFQPPAEVLAELKIGRTLADRRVS